MAASIFSRGTPTTDLPASRTAALAVAVTRSDLLRLFFFAAKLVADAKGGGLRLATELLRFDENVREALRVGAFSQMDLLMRLEDIDSGHTMDSSLASLHARGELSFEDLYEHSEDKSQVLESRGGPQGSRK